MAVPGSPWCRASRVVPGPRVRLARARHLGFPRHPAPFHPRSGPGPTRPVLSYTPPPMRQRLVKQAAFATGLALLLVAVLFALARGA